MKRIALSGFLGPLIAFMGIGIAIFINRDWWSLTDNAISDMGRIGLAYNFVLNLSLILSALVTIPSAVWMGRERKELLVRVGVLFFIVALVGLLLIGVFPEGTSPHGVVSYFFFYGGTIAMFIAGLGLAMGKRVYGYSIITVVVIEGILAHIALATFPGVAIAELIAAIGIVSSYYLLLLAHMRRV